MGKVQRVYRETFRILLLILIGAVLIHFSAIAAKEWDTPALSVWGLFLGGMLIAGAISHVMRRILFPRLDLQSIAIRAINERNIEAAIIFTVISSMLGLLIYLNASILRM